MPKIDCLVLVAPSAAGKSTLLGRLMKDFPGRFGYSISHTTRGPRPGEVPDESYHFIDEPAFKRMIANGEFLEHAVVHNTTFYGTSFRSLRDVSAQGKVAAMDLDIQGAQSMRASSLRSCIVYIQVPSFEVLEQRLRGRNTETEDKIQVRMQSARKEEDFFQANRAFFDIELMNDNLDECYAKFRREIQRICFDGENSNSNGNGNVAEEERKGERKQDSATTPLDKSPDASAASAGGQKKKNNKAAAGSQSDEEESNEMARLSGDTVAASVGRSASNAGADNNNGTTPVAMSKAKLAAAAAAVHNNNNGGESLSKENQAPRDGAASLEDAGAPRVRSRVQ
jgi:guanylate kinase